MTYTQSSYLADGPHAFYMIEAGGKQEWYSDGEKALRAWELNKKAFLFVRKKGSTELRKIR
jgi:hypothetical protein